MTAKYFPELIGREVMITAPCQTLINAISGESYDGYQTDLFHKGVRVAYPESYLRRRKPPSTGEQSVMQMFVDALQRQGVPA